MIPITAADMKWLASVAWKLERYSSMPDDDQARLKQLIASLGLTQAKGGRIYQGETLIARGYNDLINRRKAIFKETPND